MHSISALVILVCAAAQVYSQDQRVCTDFDVEGQPLPQIHGRVFSAGFEKKRKFSSSQPYTFFESGVHTYASATSRVGPAREAVKVLSARGNFKHVMDYATNQVLVLNMADAWAHDGCRAQTTQEYATNEDSIAQLIGFEQATRPMLGPLSMFFLNITASLVSDDHLHNDMAVDRYSRCYWDADKQLTVSFVWWYLNSTAIPTSAMIIYSTIGGTVNQIEYDFFNFQASHSDHIGTHPFELPPFYICTHWQHTMPPQNLSMTFAFDSEVLLKDENDKTKPDLVLSYSDQMDIIFNISRRTTSSGQMDGSVTTTTTIFDGTSGIRYHIDDRLGNCTMNIAGVDNTDILWAHLLNPADFFQNNGRQYYGGQKTWRGLPCETAVYEVEDSIYRVRVRYELYIAQNTSSIHLPVREMPIAQLVSVPPSFTPRITTYQEIFNYDVNTASIADYDISRCYVIEHQRHFVMRFPAASSVVEKYPDLLADSFIRATAVLAKLSPVRITMVDVESTDYTHISFTVLHRNDIPGSLPQMSTSTAIHTLYNAVNSGQFKVTLRYESEKQIVMTALQLEEIPRRTPLNWFRGFSDANMIEVCFGMLFGTFVVTLLFFWFVVPKFYLPQSGGGGMEVNYST